jgi:hypothetical protein
MVWQLPRVVGVAKDYGIMYSLNVIQFHVLQDMSLTLKIRYAFVIQSLRYRQVLLLYFVQR